MTLEVGGEDRKAAKRTAKALSKTSVSELELLLSTRSQYGCLRALLASKPLLPQVKRLQLRFLLSKTSKHRTPFEVPDCTQDLGRLKQVDDLQIQSQTYIHNHTLQVSHMCTGVAAGAAVKLSLSPNLQHTNKSGPTLRAEHPPSCHTLQKPLLRQSGAASHLIRACRH